MKTRHEWLITEDIDTCMHCGLMRRTISIGSSFYPAKIYLIDNKWLGVRLATSFTKFCHEPIPYDKLIEREGLNVKTLNRLI